MLWELRDRRRWRNRKIHVLEFSHERKSGSGKIVKIMGGKTKGGEKKNKDWGRFFWFTTFFWLDTFFTLHEIAT